MTRTASTAARAIITIWVHDQDAALRQGVGGDPGEQAEDHDRDELGGRHDPEPDRIVGQLQHEPGLGDLLHPGPDERDRLTDEEQPVVAMAEGAHPVVGGRAVAG